MIFDPSIDTVKQGDTARTITGTLTFNSAAINLTGATVYLIFRRVQDYTGRHVSDDAVERTATVVSAAAGTVSYQLVADDTADSGLYHLEWEINFSGGTILRVPDKGYHRLVVQPNLEA